MKRKKNQRHYFADKGPYFQSYGFSSSHVWMWELDHKESWAPKNWCFWTVVLEKTLESALGCKIKLVNPKRNQSWIFIGRTDTKAEAPILRLFDKTLMLGMIEDRRRRGQQRTRWLDGIIDSMDMSLSKPWESDSGSWSWTEKPGVLQSRGLQRVEHDWATELNWMKRNWGAEGLKAIPRSHS